MTYLWLGLNLADLLLTLYIVSAGGIELMPVSGFLLARGVWTFSAVKVGVSLLALWWLVRHPASMRVASGAMLAVVGINSLSALVLT